MDRLPRGVVGEGVDCVGATKGPVRQVVVVGLWDACLTTPTTARRSIDRSAR